MMLKSGNLLRSLLAAFVVSSLVACSIEAGSPDDSELSTSKLDRGGKKGSGGENPTLAPGEDVDGGPADLDGGPYDPDAGYDYDGGPYDPDASWTPDGGGWGVDDGGYGGGWGKDGG